MSDNSDQRFAKPQGLFGWKGFGKDKTNQTTIATVSFLVNWILAFYAVSALGSKATRGYFQFATEPIPTDFYLLGGITILACVISAALIRYEDFAARWGARAFVCGLPAALIVVLAAGLGG